MKTSSFTKGIDWLVALGKDKKEITEISCNSGKAGGKEKQGKPREILLGSLESRLGGKAVSEMFENREINGCGQS